MTVVLRRTSGFLLASPLVDVLLYVDFGLLVNTSESALQYISCGAICQIVQPELRPEKCLRDLLPYSALVVVISRNSSWFIVVLYKQLLKPVWTYGIQLCGCTKPSNIAILQRFQNKVLRDIVSAPWYVRNADLHKDLKMEMVTAEIRRFARKHEERRLHHDNVEAIQLLDSS